MHRPLIIAFLFAAAAPALAGPIAPPPGPVAPTMKTLTEIEPRTAIGDATTPGDAAAVFKIVQRGSYYLTGNITGAAGKFTIQILADNVTLDLNGFAITGGIQGVNVVSAPGTTRSNIRIRNGAIAGCSSAAIDAINAEGCEIEDMVVQACTAGGIYGGPKARVRGCTAARCGSYGISVKGGSRVSDCLASENVTGIEVATGGAADRCTATNNSFRGIDGYSEVTIRNCVASHNGDNGIDGIYGCVVESCTAQFNHLDGIHIGADGAVRSCTATANGDDGIELAHGVVTDCDSSNNGQVLSSGAGIYSSSALGTRVEGNTVNGNEYGIYVTGGAFVVRNFGRLNTTFIFSNVPSNSFGPIVTTAGMISSTNPWANFTN